MLTNIYENMYKGKIVYIRPRRGLVYLYLIRPDIYHTSYLSYIVLDIIDHPCKILVVDAIMERKLVLIWQVIKTSNLY